METFAAFLKTSSAPLRFLPRSKMAFVRTLHRNARSVQAKGIAPCLMTLAAPRMESYHAKTTLVSARLALPRKGCAPSMRAALMDTSAAMYVLSPRACPSLANFSSQCLIVLCFSYFLLHFLLKHEILDCSKILHFILPPAIFGKIS